MSMSDTGDTLQTILDGIVMDKSNNYAKLMNSALNEEIRLMVKAEVANVLLERLKLRRLDKLEASKEIENTFEDAVRTTWRKPFNLSDLLLNICLEISGNYTSNFKKDTSSERDYVLQALAKLQSNACLIFNEMLHLLKSGFPSGAQLHWRTLHEMVCVSYFIFEHDNKLAKRFLDYEAVEAYFQAKDFRTHQKRMDYEPLSSTDLKTLKKGFATMKKTYGADFVKKSNYPFGWIPRDTLKVRSLKEIEKFVKLDMFRPYYDLAGYNLIGGQNGLIFKPGTRKSKKNRLVIPVGPSNYGLADPGKSAAISLGQITSCLLRSGSGVKRLVIIEALHNLVEEICNSFSEIDAEFGKE
jgi:hypothetical protein